MSGRVLLGNEVKVLATGTATVDADTAAANVDFGTPNDLNLATIANFEHGERLLLVLTATASGTTDSVSFSVLDAPDSSGSIGTTAAAKTDGTAFDGTGAQHAVVGIELKSDRPWVQVAVANDGTTDTFVVTALLLALPGIV